MTTDLNDLIAPSGVLDDVKVPTRKALFGTLGSAAASRWALDAKLVADALGAREKLGTTGFGGGVALPHARLEGLGRVRGLFARLVRPLDYKAVDDQPVDLVLMLLSPTDAGADHLKALARVSRRLREAGLPAKLRGAASRDAIYALLTGSDLHDTA